MRTAGPSINDSLSRGHVAARWPAAAALIALCAAVYLPGVFSIPPVDRDECRFAQASRQMLQSGDWVVPRFQDRTRLNKPPLIYWIQAATAWALGDPAAHEPGAVPPAYDPTGGIWRYRLPSVAAATLSVLIVWRLGRRMFDPRAAWLGAAFLAVCPVVAWDAHQARSDQVLMTTIVAAQGALWSIWRSRHHASRPWGAPLAMWGALTLGVLTKGPVAPMVVVLTALAIAAVTREWRWLARTRPLLGLAVVSAAAGSWLALVAGQVGWDHLAERLRRELVERNTNAQEGHWGPPGYHLAVLVLLFWPGTLATLAGVIRGWRLGIGRGLGAIGKPAAGREAELFCLAWIVPAWIVFEIVGTKLPHYTMPLYPAVALLSAWALLGMRPEATGGRDGGRAIGLGGIVPWAIVGAVLIVGAPIFISLAADKTNDVPIIPNLLSLVARGAAIAMLLVSVRLALRSQLAASQVWAVGAMALTLATLTGLQIPYLAGDAQVSSKVVAAIRTVDPLLSRPIAAIGYHEDSLVFLTGGRIRRIDDPARQPGEPDLASFFAAHPDGIVVLPLGHMKERTTNRGVGDGPPFLRLHAIELVSGWNYSRGRAVQLQVVELERTP